MAAWVWPKRTVFWPSRLLAAAVVTEVVYEKLEAAAAKLVR